MAIVSKAYKLFVEWLSLGGRGPEPAFIPHREVLAGSLVYDTGFPFKVRNQPGTRVRIPAAAPSTESLNPILGIFGASVSYCMY
jgi:hypothetical protein